MKQELTGKNIVPLDINQFVEDLENNATDKRRQLTHDEVLDRIRAYFNSITRTVHDQETGEVTTEWISPPTKSGLARSLGIDRSTLVDYVSGIGSKGIPYTEEHGNQKVRAEDMPLVRSAVAFVEEFYEGRLASSGNQSGSIFFLLNSRARTWQQWTKIEEQEEVPKRRALTANELPTLAQLELSETDSK